MVANTNGPFGFKSVFMYTCTVCVCVHTQICMYVFMFTELIQSYTYTFTSECTQISCIFNPQRT